jgi:hypothetical protein
VTAIIETAGSIGNNKDGLKTQVFSIGGIKARAKAGIGLI